MKIEDYRFAFVSCITILLIIGFIPIIAFNVSFIQAKHSFSELWILGSEKTISNYPYQISENQTVSFWAGVRNRMGYPVYYVMFLKIRNQTQSLPDVIKSTPSPVPPLLEFIFFLENDDTWENRLNFTITRSVEEDKTFSIRAIRINNLTLETDLTFVWDSQNNGFFSQIILELWLYNLESREVQFHDRYVTIWLNMTKN